MKIIPKHGFGDLVFGMQQQHVVAMYGKPDSQFKDEENNMVYLYNQYKMRLTFYDDEEYRLGYIVISHPEATLFDKPVIGKIAKEIQAELPQKQFSGWETAEEDGIESVFNEDNWLILLSEFSEITKVEVGAVIINDEFDWKFSG